MRYDGVHGIYKCRLKLLLLWRFKLGHHLAFEPEENPHVPTFDTFVKSLLTKIFENMHEGRNSITLQIYSM